MAFMVAGGTGSPRGDELSIGGGGGVTLTEMTVLPAARGVSTVSRSKSSTIISSSSLAMVAMDCERQLPSANGAFALNPALGNEVS